MVKDLVIQEIENLKQHATQEEIGKLNLETFDEQSAYRCIYGQMTGWCDSERALELLSLCAKPYSTMMRDVVTPTKSKYENYDRDAWSALEFYIYDNPSEARKIVEYLKGNTDTLELV